MLTALILYTAASVVSLPAAGGTLPEENIEKINVPIVDKTPQDSPVRITTGQVLLQETVAGNELKSSWSGKVIATNTSNKAILLIVASLKLVGRHNRGSIRGPGDGATYLVSHDRFFRDVIKPDDTMTLWEARQSDRPSECCINPLDAVDSPQAEFKVRFVQFVDGSSFGDPNEAKSDLALRMTIVRGLRELLESYEKLGEQAFDSGVLARTPWSSTFVFGQIWAIYQENGAKASVSEVRRILALVATRESALGATMP